ncbi:MULTISPECIES: tryptophan synthase subunit alpha [unclassified Pseudonocardia]|uniref:tryptophan synthase subunit alpha n=1 Tax=unclassified Pseudonocardia TaxID=2619320 RepID=UPI0001FFE0D3|nr:MULTISPECIES: tryptophan synthase subunit alpha [unclassified Pseudonocardia]ALE75355.1 tryptophan synthase subunit alpha [Pseudonocardia sp. EC080625-04]ALL74715.1 tryptophan synthase subunit alpha [Pseudonocardia sp. EC080610-09]ALL81738.1 tryptophan synthase subunit alpha [Pseudonocardia sp. EC080619-01]OLM15956.1 Tryptophan synthase alpha chain [Pseudonocardia sp. Ae707_Ps1]
MSVAQRIEAVRAEGRAALVGYLPVGFPSVDGSVEAMRAMVEGGVDVVEVGLPYSDPLMDGPVIQRATQQALDNGARSRDAFTAVRGVADAGAPAVVMTYWNLIDRYGVERFAAELAAAGGSGLITPDLLPDDAEEWLAASERHDLDRIFLVAQTTTPERMRLTVGASRGFLYAASLMGVTGVRSIGAEARELVGRAREVATLPVCVGLGVRTAEHAAEVASYADGVIVGTAFVQALESGGPSAVRDLAQELSEGIRSATPVSA